MNFDRSQAYTQPDFGAARSLAEARFIPRQYEPNYAYPLLVLLHGRGGDEDQLVRTMPNLSWRNYVGLGLRGPEAIVKREQPAGFGWGAEFERPDRVKARWNPPGSEGELLHRLLSEATPAIFDHLETSVFEAILKTRRLLHIHSERIFLVGYGEGAAVAYWLGLTYPERFAGIVAINGWLPVGLRPLGRLKACREIPVLVVHGAWNSKVPLAEARRSVSVLRAGGLNVAFQSYPSSNRITKGMLADIDGWIMNHCTNDARI